MKERRQLRKQWKKATEEEKQGINLFQELLRGRLRALRRAEHLQKKRKRKERVRTSFYRDTFVKVLFSQEEGRQLKSAKLEVEDYLRKTYSDLKMKGNLGLPLDIHPFGEVGHEMDIRPPKWMEVQEAVMNAKASSAPRPNGVPYWVYGL